MCLSGCFAPLFVTVVDAMLTEVGRRCVSRVFSLVACSAICPCVVHVHDVATRHTYGRDRSEGSNARAFIDLFVRVGWYIPTLPPPRPWRPPLSPVAAAATKRTCRFHAPVSIPATPNPAIPAYGNGSRPKRTTAPYALD